MYMYMCVYNCMKSVERLWPKWLSSTTCLQQLQEKDAELCQLQEEMARGAAALDQLSSQLEVEKSKGTLLNRVSG